MTSRTRRVPRLLQCSAAASRLFRPAWNLLHLVAGLAQAAPAAAQQRAAAAVRPARAFCLGRAGRARPRRAGCWTSGEQAVNSSSGLSRRSPPGQPRWARSQCDLADHHVGDGQRLVLVVGCAEHRWSSPAALLRLRGSRPAHSPHRPLSKLDSGPVQQRHLRLPTTTPGPARPAAAGRRTAPAPGGRRTRPGPRHAASAYWPLCPQDVLTTADAAGTSRSAARSCPARSRHDWRTMPIGRRCGPT